MKVSFQKNLYSQVEYIETSEQLEAVFNQPEVWKKILDIRQLRQADKMQEAQKVKESLPAIIFVADHFSESVNKFGQKGAWRCQPSSHLNGLAVLDADHLTEKPAQIFTRWTPEHLKELGIYLVFITSSEEGVKVVFKARPEWGNLIENVRMMGRELGLPVDESGKDSSRASFVPSELAGDILYYDGDGMFNCDGSQYDSLFGEAYRRGESAGSKVNGTDAKPGSLAVHTFRISEHTYKGVPMQKIVDCWVGRELPQEGERHKTSLCLADELRYICDSDPELIEGVLRAQSWVNDIVRERGENVAQTVKSALAYKEEKRIPPRMYHALREAGVDVESGISKNQLPYEKWAESLKKMKLGCYKSAISYIDNPLIYPGGIITSGGMYDTLLTNCWYTDWQGIQHRLNGIFLAIGDPASGKGFAVEQDDAIMNVMREADKTGRIAEREYKEGLQERSTSQKEQKKDALKRPDDMVRYCPVKTSNAVLYRRMENSAIEMPDGTSFYHHLYTFASELLSIVNARGSFQEKRDLMLHSFHNELNGVDYSNTESVNAIIPVFYNLVATGTGSSLSKFVHAGNIGDGMSTRMSCFIMPKGQFKMRPLRSKPRSERGMNEMRMWGRRFDALQGEIKGLKKLVDHIYHIVALKAEEANNQGDEITVTMCMRMQDKLMAICIPQVISTQKSWEQFRHTMTAKVTKQHLEFATLMFDVLLTCEDALFGLLWQDYFNKEYQTVQPRITYDKTSQNFKRLPEIFTTADVMDIWGFTSNVTASAKCKQMVDHCQAQKLKRGQYQKLVSTI
ncbi:MAG: hypothetical protein J5671_09645 [Bacteroidaceae bacterium]|nr:hypothetical protein [Bacteroidaceae bacterium]